MSKRNFREEKIAICSREYFNSDQTILIHSSMLRVRDLISLMLNNTYFGNKILFSKNDVDAYESFTEEVNGELVTKNAKQILEFITKSPSEYQVVNIEEGEKGILRFLKKNKDVILYTTEIRLKEFLENKGLRCRRYRKQAIFDQNDLKVVKYTSLDKIENRAKCNFVKTSKQVKVYNSNKEELSYEEVKLTVDDIILVIEPKGDITRYIIYRVVNYHSKRNLIQIAWTDVKPDSEEIRFIPEDLVEIVRENLNKI